MQYVSCIEYLKGKFLVSLPKYNCCLTGYKKKYVESNFLPETGFYCLLSSVEANKKSVIGLSDFSIFFLCRTVQSNTVITGYVWPVKL